MKNYISNILKVFLKEVCIPIIVTVLTLIIVKNYINKAYEPEIHPIITYNSGLNTTIVSHYKVDYKTRFLLDHHKANYS